MLFYAIIGLINGIVGILVGSFVYFKDRKAIVNKSFVQFCLAVAVWSYGYFIWQISSTAEEALFWSRVLMIGSIFIPITFFHFVIIFLNIFQKEKKVLIFGYLLTVLFFISNFTSLFVNRVEPALFFPFWPKPGPVFHFFHLMFVTFIIYSWYLLHKEQQKVSGIRKLQIKYVLLGSLIGFVGGATNHFLWYNIPIPPYGNFLPVIGFLLYAFAILKYHLFEIRVIVTEILVGMMGILLLVFSFLLPGNYKFFGLGIFLLFCIFAYYLVKATHEEEKRREEAERLAKERGEMAEQYKIMAIKAEALRKSEEEFARQARETANRERKLREEAERLNKVKTEFFILSTHHW